MDEDTFYEHLREDDYSNLLDVLGVLCQYELDVVATNYSSLSNDDFQKPSFGTLELLIRGDRLKDFDKARKALDIHLLGKTLSSYHHTLLPYTSESLLLQDPLSENYFSLLTSFEYQGTQFFLTFSRTDEPTRDPFCVDLLINEEDRKYIHTLKAQKVIFELMKIYRQQVETYFGGEF